MPENLLGDTRQVSGPFGNTMIDYYPYLLRAVQDAADEPARRAVYVRAWQVVTDELRARRPPVSEALSFGSTPN